MPRGLRVAAVALTIALLVSVTTFAALGAPSEHFLYYSEDTYKAQFISGNLTASVTHDFPRVVFEHSANLFTPMFAIGMKRMFLFNDTNGDDVFSRSEAFYTAFLDSNYVKWSMGKIQFVQSDEGESAEVSLLTTVSLYGGYVDDTEDEPDITDWANITFTFMISENPVTYSNSRGEYIVSGKTDLRIRMNIEILKHVSVSRLVLEQDLLAGGSVHHFLLKERSPSTDAFLQTNVPGRVDERGAGLGFTHKINQTSLPTQDVDMAKKDGTVLAYYRFSSEPTSDILGASRSVGLNSSYYTTGTSMVLYLAYSLGNETADIAHDMSIGLDMRGFVRVRDWAAANLPILAIVSGGLILLAGVSVHAWRRKRMRLLEDGAEMKRDIENEMGHQ